MSLLTRRQLLHAGAVTAAGLTVGPLHADAAKPKFKLGLVTYNLAAAWDLDHCCDVCKDAGVSPVEFRTTHKHGVEPSLSKEQRQEVKKKCADAGRRHLGLRHGLRVSVARQSRRRQEEHRDVQGRSWSWSPTSAAAASRCGPTAARQGAGREDAGADRQGADPVRPGGRRRRPRNLGRGPRQQERPTRRT